MSAKTCFDSDPRVLLASFLVAFSHSVSEHTHVDFFLTMDNDGEHAAAVTTTSHLPRMNNLRVAALQRIRLRSNHKLFAVQLGVAAEGWMPIGPSNGRQEVVAFVLTYRLICLTPSQASPGQDHQFETSSGLKQRPGRVSSLSSDHFGKRTKTCRRGIGREQKGATAEKLVWSAAKMSISKA